MAFAAISVLMAGRGLGQTAGPDDADAGQCALRFRPPVREWFWTALVAVVNGDVLLESDVDEERRFEEFSHIRTIAESTRAKIIERLVDRALILQQAAVEPEDAVTDKELDAQMVTLRKDIPECEQYHCETDGGWNEYLAHHGFTEEEFARDGGSGWSCCSSSRCGSGTASRITDEEIKDYYEKTMLPEYAKRNVTPPPLESIKRRIEEVLLQQQVSALLEDWLKSLRAQGSVRIMTPGRGGPLSDLDKKLTEKKRASEGEIGEGGGEIAKVKRSLATRMGRAVAWCVIGFVILVMVLVRDVRVVFDDGRLQPARGCGGGEGSGECDGRASGVGRDALRPAASGD